MSLHQIGETKILIKDRVSSYLKDKENITDDELFNQIKAYEDLDEFYSDDKEKNEKLKEIIVQAKKSIQDEKQKSEQKQQRTLDLHVMKKLHEGYSVSQVLCEQASFEFVERINSERKDIIVTINNSIQRGKKNNEIFSEIKNKYPAYETMIHQMIYAQKIEMNRLKFRAEPAVKRDLVFSDIQTVIKELPDSDMGDVETKLAQLLRKAKEALKKGDFVTAELNLNCHRDLQRGIISRYVTHDKSGKPLNMPLYLADARHVLKESEQKDTFENWASMGLSYFRIAVRMIEERIIALQTKGQTHDSSINEQIDALEKEIDSINSAAAHFLDEISKLMNHDELFQTREDQRHAAEIYESHAISQVLIPEVSKVLGWKNTKALQEEMAKLKDFGNLDRKPFASATLTQGLKNNNEFTLRSDVPVYQLTKKQQSEIRAIIDNPDEDNRDLPDWYKNQTDREAKKLIRLYAPAILQGRDLPTQMLQFIPYLRNAKQIHYYNASKTDTEHLSFEKYSDNYGTGNIGNEIVGVSENVRIKGTQEALNQFQEATSADKIYLQSLVTTSRIRLGIMNAWAFITGGKKPGDEVVIDTNDRAAVLRQNIGNEKTSTWYQFSERWLPSRWTKFFFNTSISQNNRDHTENTHENSPLIQKPKTEFVYGNLAINDTRRINNPDMTAIHAVSQQVTEYLTHAREVSNDEKMCADIQKIIIQLRWVQEEYHDLNSFVFIDDDNRNLQMASKLEQMVSLMRIYREKCVSTGIECINLPQVVSSSFCKSAKDRAGMVQITAAESEARRNAVAELDPEKINRIYENSTSKTTAKMSVLKEIYPTQAQQKNYKAETLKAIWAQIKGGHVGRSAANQSAGCEGIKNGEGIIPKWIVNELKHVGVEADNEDLRALLERREAHFNSKVGKIKESHAFVQKVLSEQQFEFYPSNSSALNESLEVELNANPADFFEQSEKNEQVITEEEQKQIEMVEKQLCPAALKIAHETQCLSIFNNSDFSPRSPASAA